MTHKTSSYLQTAMSASCSVSIMSADPSRVTHICLRVQSSSKSSQHTAYPSCMQHCCTYSHHSWTGANAGGLEVHAGPLLCPHAWFVHVRAAVLPDASLSHRVHINRTLTANFIAPCRAAMAQLRRLYTHTGGQQQGAPSQQQSDAHAVLQLLADSIQSLDAEALAQLAALALDLRAQASPIMPAIMSAAWELVSTTAPSTAATLMWIFARYDPCSWAALCALL